MLYIDEKPAVLRREPFKGAIAVSKKPSITEIEQLLGFDSVQPIHLTSSDEQDMKEKDDELRDWYEDELREFFEKTH